MENESKAKQSKAKQSRLPTGRFSPLFRLINLTLAFVFVSTSVTYGVPRNLWDGQAAQKSVVEKSVVSLVFLDPAKFIIPENYGSVTERFTSAGTDNSKKLIIQIQDSHCNYEAQTNIRGIVETIGKDKEMSSACRLIATEGAQGLLDPTFMRAVPDKTIRAEVSDNFVKTGWLTGTEMYEINAKEEPLPLWGVEEKQLYDENLDYFRKVKAGLEKERAFIEKLTNLLDTLKLKVFSKGVAELMKMRADWDNNTVAFTEYCGYLEKIARDQGLGEKGAAAFKDAKEYPNFTLVMETMEIEKKIDTKKIDGERKAFIAALQKKMVKEEVSELVKQSLYLRIGKVTSDMFYAYLQAQAAAKKMDMAAYPALAGYMEIVFKSSRINAGDLFEEVDKIEKAIKGKMLKTGEEKQLDQLIDDARVLRNMLDLRMTRRDLSYYRDRSRFIAPTELIRRVARLSDEAGMKDALAGSLAWLDENKDLDLKACEGFYDAAIERDKVMVEKTVQEMEKRRANAVAFVSGGFHTQGVKELFKAKGYSYVVVTPRMTQKYDDNIYLSRMLNEQSEYDKLFANTGNRLAVWMEMGSRRFNNKCALDVVIRAMKLEKEGKLKTKEGKVITWKKFASNWKNVLIERAKQDPSLAFLAENIDKIQDIKDLGNEKYDVTIALDDNSVTTRECSFASGKMEYTGGIKISRSVGDFLADKLALLKSKSKSEKLNLVVEPEVIRNRTELQMDERVLEAVYKLAEDHHLGQTRKDEAKSNYLFHLLGVTATLLGMGETEKELIVAGIFHDILEDSRYMKSGQKTRADVENDIRTVLKGSDIDAERVIELVRAVTRKPKKEGEPEQTHEEYMAQVLGVDCAIMLKYTDRVYNLRDVVNATKDEFVEKAINKTIKEIFTVEFMGSLPNDNLRNQMRELFLEVVLTNYLKGNKALLKLDNAYYVTLLKAVIPGINEQELRAKTVVEMLNNALDDLKRLAAAQGAAGATVYIDPKVHEDVRKALAQASASAVAERLPSVTARFANEDTREDIRAKYVAVAQADLEKKISAEKDAGKKGKLEKQLAQLSDPAVRVLYLALNDSSGLSADQKKELRRALLSTYGLIDAAGKLNYDKFYDEFAVPAQTANKTKEGWLTFYEAMAAFVDEIESNITDKELEQFAPSVHDNGYWLNLKEKIDAVKVANAEQLMLGMAPVFSDTELNEYFTDEGKKVYQKRYADPAGYKIMLSHIKEEKRTDFIAKFSKKDKVLLEKYFASDDFKNLKPEKIQIFNANAGSWEALAKDAKNYPDEQSRLKKMRGNQKSAMASAFALTNLDRLLSHAQMNYATATIWRYKGHWSGESAYDNVYQVTLAYDSKEFDADRYKDGPIWRAVLDRKFELRGMTNSYERFLNLVLRRLTRESKIAFHLGFDAVKKMVDDVKAEIAQDMKTNPALYTELAKVSHDLGYWPGRDAAIHDKNDTALGLAPDFDISEYLTDEGKKVFNNRYSNAKKGYKLMVSHVMPEKRAAFFEFMAKKYGLDKSGVIARSASLNPDDQIFNVNFGTWEQLEKNAEKFGADKDIRLNVMKNNQMNNIIAVRILKNAGVFMSGVQRSHILAILYPYLMQGEFGYDGKDRTGNADPEQWRYGLEQARTNYYMPSFAGQRAIDHEMWIQMMNALARAEGKEADFLKEVVLASTNESQLGWEATLPAIEAEFKNLRGQINGWPDEKRKEYAKSVHNNGYRVDEKKKIDDPSNVFAGSHVDLDAKGIDVAKFMNETAKEWWNNRYIPEYIDKFNKLSKDEKKKLAASGIAGIGIGGYKFSDAVFKDAAARTAFYTACGKSEAAKKAATGAVIMNENSMDFEDLLKEANRYAGANARVKKIYNNQYDGIAVGLLFSKLLEAGVPLTREEMVYLAAVLWRYYGGAYFDKNGFDWAWQTSSDYLMNLDRAEREKDMRIIEAVFNVMNKQLPKGAPFVADAGVEALPADADIENLDLKIGDSVYLKINDKWYRGRIADYRGDGLLDGRYDENMNLGNQYWRVSGFMVQLDQTVPGVFMPPNGTFLANDLLDKERVKTKREERLIAKAARAVPAAVPASIAVQDVGDAFAKSGLKQEDVDLLKKVSGNKVMTINEFLQSGRAVRGAYGLGLTKLKGIYEALCNVLGLKHWMDAYDQQLMLLARTPEFLTKIAKEGKPIVFFVPSNIFTESSNVTSKEMQWFLETARKGDPDGLLKNVIFVFGAYDAVSDADFNALSATDRNVQLAKLFSEGTVAATGVAPAEVITGVETAKPMDAVAGLTDEKEYKEAALIKRAAEEYTRGENVALNELVKIGPSAVMKLKKTLNLDEKEVLTEEIIVAAMALGMIGAVAKEPAVKKDVIDALSRAMAYTHPGIEKAVLNALATIGGSGVVAVLKEHITKPRPGGTSAAAIALAKITGEGEAGPSVETAKAMDAVAGLTDKKGFKDALTKMFNEKVKGATKLDLAALRKYEPGLTGNDLGRAVVMVVETDDIGFMPEKYADRLVEIDALSGIINGKEVILVTRGWLEAKKRLSADGALKDAVIHEVSHFADRKEGAHAHAVAKESGARIKLKIALAGEKAAGGSLVHGGWLKGLVENTEEAKKQIEGKVLEDTEKKTLLGFADMVKKAAQSVTATPAQNIAVAKSIESFERKVREIIKEIEGERFGDIDSHWMVTEDVARRLLAKYLHENHTNDLTEEAIGIILDSATYKWDVYSENLKPNIYKCTVSFKEDVFPRLYAARAAALLEQQKVREAKVKASEIKVEKIVASLEGLIFGRGKRYEKVERDARDELLDHLKRQYPDLTDAEIKAVLNSVTFKENVPLPLLLGGSVDDEWSFTVSARKVAAAARGVRAIEITLNGLDMLATYRGKEEIIKPLAGIVSRAQTGKVTLTKEEEELLKKVKVAGYDATDVSLTSPKSLIGQLVVQTMGGLAYKGPAAATPAENIAVAKSIESFERKVREIIKEIEGKRFGYIYSHWMATEDVARRLLAEYLHENHTNDLTEEAIGIILDSATYKWGVYSENLKPNIYKCTVSFKEDVFPRLYAARAAALLEQQKVREAALLEQQKVREAKVKASEIKVEKIVASLEGLIFGRGKRYEKVERDARDELLDHLKRQYPDLTDAEIKAVLNSVTFKENVPLPLLLGGSVDDEWSFTVSARKVAAAAAEKISEQMKAAEDQKIPALQRQLEQITGLKGKAEASRQALLEALKGRNPKLIGLILLNMPADVGKKSEVLSSLLNDRPVQILSYLANAGIAGDMKSKISEESRADYEALLKEVGDLEAREAEAFPLYGIEPGENGAKSASDFKKVARALEPVMEGRAGVTRDMNELILKIKGVTDKNEAARILRPHLQGMKDMQTTAGVGVEKFLFFTLAEHTEENEYSLVKELLVDYGLIKGDGDIEKGTSHVDLANKLLAAIAAKKWQSISLIVSPENARLLLDDKLRNMAVTLVVADKVGAMRVLDEEGKKALVEAGLEEIVVAIENGDLSILDMLDIGVGTIDQRQEAYNTLGFQA